MKSKTNQVAIIVASLALVVSVVLTIFIYLLSTQLQDIRKDVFINNTQQGYSIGKLEFCVNHAITTCDDTSIASWNSAHPNEQFSLQTYQQLIEKGIAEYEISRK